MSDLAIVFNVAVESEDTGFNGARSSTFDEGAKHHPCEAEVEITSSEVDHVVVKLFKMWCALRWQERITAKNEAGGSHQEGSTSRAIQVDRHVARCSIMPRKFWVVA